MPLHPPPAPPEAPVRSPLAVRAVQALVLGTLLFVALVRWMQLAGDAHLFRYQGF